MMQVGKNNIFLVGPMGAGKTTVGKMLADALGMDFFDSDCEIEKRTGVDLAWIFDVEGEGNFRKREIAVIEDLTERQGVVLATGGGTVLEEASRKFLVARGYVIYLKASVAQQMLRTEHDSSRRPTLIDSGDEKEGLLESMRTERAPLYESVADMVFDMDEIAVTTAVKHLISHLRSL